MADSYKTDDIVIAKVSNIKECLRKIQKITGGNADTLDDSIVEDVFVLNCQRAIQSCIDLAHYRIAQSGLSVPTEYQESFEIISKEGMINKDLCESMKKMVGFRNIAVHEYSKLNKKILKSILTKHLVDIEKFYKSILS
jgi:uncharacterized protein YutE (UPF0331/DUF86 family)